MESVGTFHRPFLRKGEKAHRLYNQLGNGARDDAAAMQLLDCYSEGFNIA